VTTADFNPDDFQGSQQSKMDEGLLVRFYVKARQDQVATNRAGKPLFKDVDYIEIRVPGQRNFVARPATPRDKARFPRHWEAYKSRTSEDEYLEGTPLIEWPLITRSQCEELSFANVKTVEQLLAMPDSNAQQFLGMNVLRAKAKIWLENASKGAAKAELQAELDKRDTEIEKLKQQMAELLAKPAKVTKKKASKKKAKKKVAKKE